LLRTRRRGLQVAFLGSSACAVASQTDAERSDDRGAQERLSESIDGFDREANHFKIHAINPAHAHNEPPARIVDIAKPAIDVSNNVTADEHGMVFPVKESSTTARRDRNEFHAIASCNRHRRLLARCLSDDSPQTVAGEIAYLVLLSADVTKEPEVITPPMSTEPKARGTYSFYETKTLSRTVDEDAGPLAQHPPLQSRELMERSQLCRRIETRHCLASRGPRERTHNARSGVLLRTRLGAPDRQLCARSEPRNHDSG
jgi:hypothetical protein